MSKRSNLSTDLNPKKYFLYYNKINRKIIFRNYKPSSEDLLKNKIEDAKVIVEELKIELNQVFLIIF